MNFINLRNFLTCLTEKKEEQKSFFEVIKNESKISNFLKEKGLIKNQETIEEPPKEELKEISTKHLEKVFFFLIFNYFSNLEKSFNDIFVYCLNNVSFIFISTSLNFSFFDFFFKNITHQAIYTFGLSSFKTENFQELIEYKRITDSLKCLEQIFVKQIFSDNVRRVIELKVTTFEVSFFIITIDNMGIKKLEEKITISKFKLDPYIELFCKNFFSINFSDFQESYIGIFFNFEDKDLEIFLHIKFLNGLLKKEFKRLTQKEKKKIQDGKKDFLEYVLRKFQFSKKKMEYDEVLTKAKNKQPSTFEDIMRKYGEKKLNKLIRLFQKRKRKFLRLLEEKTTKKQKYKLLISLKKIENFFCLLTNFLDNQKKLKSLYQEQRIKITSFISVIKFFLIQRFNFNDFFPLIINNFLLTEFIDEEKFKDLVLKIENYFKKKEENTNNLKKSFFLLYMFFVIYMKIKTEKTKKKEIISKFLEKNFFSTGRNFQEEFRNFFLKCI